MIKSEQIYFDKLRELLVLQNKILTILKKGEVVENKNFEDREKLISEIIILKPARIIDEALKIKQDIIDIEKKINKEAEFLENMSKLKIEQHNKSVLKMVNYFKSQIDLQSEIDLNI